MNKKVSINLSVEQTPSKILKDQPSEVLLTYADKISITHLPGTRLKETTKAAKTLVDRDKVNPTRIMPHVSARAIQSKAELTRNFGVWADMGIQSLVVIGGPHKESIYPTDDSVAIKAKEKGFSEILCGVYPDKQSVSYYEHYKYDRVYTGGISQVCLSPKRLSDFCGGDTRFGVPSRASFSSLWGYLKICGVGPSLSNPFRNLCGMLKYTTSDGFDTVQFVFDINDAGVFPIHVYDFGNIEKTIEDLVDTFGT